MGWHGVPPLGIGCYPFATPENFLAFFFYCCFIIVAKERSPKILVEMNLALCTYKKIQSFLPTLYTFEYDNRK